MKKVVSIVTTAMLVIVLFLAIALVGVRIFGLSPYTVLSGSMEPHYPVGSLIYVKEVDPNTLEVNDPITYVIEGGTVVTHRIIEIIPGEDGALLFKTKGDANQVEDGTPVHSKNVVGKPVFNVPLLGYVAYFVQNPPGSYLSIGFCVIAVLLTFLPDLLDKLLAEEPSADQPSESEAAAAKADPSPPGDANEHPPNNENSDKPPG